MLIDKRKIELLMAEKKLTKTALQKAAGISESTVTNVFRRGSSTPYTVGKLADALGVNVKDIVNEVE